MKEIIFFIFLFTSCIILGQENPLEETIKKATDYEKMGYYSFNVKSLPNNQNQSVACVIKSEEAIDNEGFLDVDLVLILIDNTTKKILAIHTEKDKFTSDAIRLDAVVLDMSNYRVAGGVRAFGVRDSYTGSSHPNPYDSENLSLYTIKNNQFQLILDKFETHTYNAETDMNCYLDGEETNSVLIMQKTKTNGYYDIKVKSTKTIRTVRNPKIKDGDCIETIKKLKPKFQTLRFVKDEYQLKKK